VAGFIFLKHTLAAWLGYPCEHPEMTKVCATVPDGTKVQKRWERWEKELEEDNEKAQKRVLEILKEYGLESAQTNGDPRGYPYGCHFPNGHYNSMGGKEYGYRF
jgi:hypothetical protein